MSVPPLCRKTPIFTTVVALTLVLLLPVTSVLAYSHDIRDDAGSLNTTYFHAYNVNESWVNQTNENNGYDYDTAIDCIEEYSDCVRPGTSDYATWKPFPSPSPYWMCPYAHVAKQANWSNAVAVYHTHTAGGDAYSSMLQSQYLNAWYAPPNGDFTTNDYEKIIQGGSGDGVITADTVDFHYNPNNANDSSCA